MRFPGEAWGLVSTSLHTILSLKDDLYFKTSLCAIKKNDKIEIRMLDSCSGLKFDEPFTGRVPGLHIEQLTPGRCCTLEPVGFFYRPNNIAFIMDL